jgi:hypothetical protein
LIRYKVYVYDVNIASHPAVCSFTRASEALQEGKDRFLGQTTFIKLKDRERKLIFHTLKIEKPLRALE